jgi:hypothetical protein
MVVLIAFTDCAGAGFDAYGCRCVTHELACPVPQSVRTIIGIDVTAFLFRVSYRHFYSPRSLIVYAVKLYFHSNVVFVCDGNARHTVHILVVDCAFFGKFFSRRVFFEHRFDLTARHSDIYAARERPFIFRDFDVVNIFIRE